MLPFVIQGGQVFGSSRKAVAAAMNTMAGMMRSFMPSFYADA
jgi:hypothetical protein